MRIQKSSSYKVLLCLIVCLFLFSSSKAFAIENKDSILQERRGLYLKVAALTHVPWTMIAAVDQYERNCHRIKGGTQKKGPIGITVEPKKWVGALNPDQEDMDPLTIEFFGGIGKDGNGDGKADQHDPEDVIYSIASYLASFGTTIEDEKLGLKSYYERDKCVEIILELAKLYKTYNTIDLSEHDFPIPLNRNYSYTSSWGAGRGWGGRRIHEGTDIFANYGTPVKSTTYGIVELKGWNKYGGWRIGIRDPYTLYHYYAHLQAYAKGIHTGMLVKPGDIIGYVGSTGYGPPGTAGRFPPHLHYGIYGYNGKMEYSFDPYPSLRRWEVSAKKKKK